MNRIKGEPRRFINGHGRIKPVVDRFWIKVDQTGDCWKWLGSKPKPKYGESYGAFRLGKKMLKAHQAAWILTNGLIPPGMCVLHKCDNPNCVNPSHLFIGTHQENIQDMVSKGRGSHAMGKSGEAHPLAKLSAKDVSEIRSIGRDEKTTILADKYGVSTSIIRRILNNKLWKGVK
ncbi:MAG: HNH endonuclease signature motif containing protein [Bacteroidales bacterium]